MAKKFTHKYLSEDELSKISAVIAEIEKQTAAELVITIKEKRNWRERKIQIFNLAEKEFLSAGINKTKSKTGILFFIIFNSKEFCILADKKINDLVDQSVWDDLVKEITASFRQGKFLAGILLMIEKAGKILSSNFPIGSNDINELPNDVRII